MNIQEIKAEIAAAALSQDTRDYLMVDEHGNRRVSAILHPTSTDQVVWNKIIELAPMLAQVQANILANATGENRVSVSKSLKYFVESGLMTTSGKKAATTYRLANGVDANSTLPTVEAQQRGRKPNLQEAGEVAESVQATPEPEPANEAPKKFRSRRKAG